MRTAQGQRIAAVGACVAVVAALFDHSDNGPSLPPGHPFNNILTDRRFGSATTDASNAALAWAVSFGREMPVLNVNKNGAEGGYARCVRGGMNADRY